MCGVFFSLWFFNMTPTYFNVIFWALSLVQSQGWSWFWPPSCWRGWNKWSKFRKRDTKRWISIQINVTNTCVVWFCNLAPILKRPLTTIQTTNITYPVSMKKIWDNYLHGGLEFLISGILAHSNLWFICSLAKLTNDHHSCSLQPHLEAIPHS